MADTNPNEERPLEAWLESFGPFGVLEALPILEALAATLVELHAAGRVHARLGHEHVRVLERDGTCVLSLPEPWGEQENPHLGFTRDADLRTLGQLATRLLTGREPQRTGGPKGPIRPLWLVEPRLPFELSALVHALVRDGSRDLPKTASVKERLSLLLAELEGSLPDQEPSAAPLGSTPATSDVPPRRTTTTTFATADVIAKLLEKPPEEPVPPSSVPWGGPATPASTLRSGTEQVRPKQGRLATKQELPSLSGPGSPSARATGAPSTSARHTGLREAAPVGSSAQPEQPVNGPVDGPRFSGRAEGRSTVAAATDDARTDEARDDEEAARPDREADEGAVDTAPGFVRDGDSEDAIVTSPGAPRVDAEDAVVTSPGEPRVDAEDAVVTAPDHAGTPLDEDEVVATSPGHSPAAAGDDEAPPLSPDRSRKAPGDDGVSTVPAYARGAVEDEAARTSPGYVPESDANEAATSRPGRTDDATEDDGVSTVPAYARVAVEDEAVRTVPGYVPESGDGEAAASGAAPERDAIEADASGSPSMRARAASEEDAIGTLPACVREAADEEDAAGTLPAYVREAADEDEVRTSPGHVPAADDAAVSAHEGTSDPGEEADGVSTLSSQRPGLNGEAPAAGDRARSREVAASIPSGSSKGHGPEVGSGSASASPAAKVHTRRSPSEASAPVQLAGEHATALGPDPRHAPRRTPGASPRSRTPSRPRGSEPDEPTRAAPRAGTPPRPVRTGPARLVFGGAAAAPRPSRAKLVIGGGDTEARPSRAKLVIGGGDTEARPSRAKLVIGGGAAAGDGAQVTTRSETQDLALEPWALPTVQVTVPEDILGPLPGPLRRLGSRTPPTPRAVPGEVALPRHSVMLRAAAQARPHEAEEASDEDALEPTRPLEPLPSPDAPWLAETVHPDERLTPAEVLRLIPVWVWVLLAILVLGLALIFGSTAPTDSRVLPEERRMIPGLEASAAPGP